MTPADASRHAELVDRAALLVAASGSLVDRSRSRRVEWRLILDEARAVRRGSSMGRPAPPE